MLDEVSPPQIGVVAALLLVAGIYSIFARRRSGILLTGMMVLVLVEVSRVFWTSMRADIMENQPRLYAWLHPRMAIGLTLADVIGAGALMLVAVSYLFRKVRSESSSEPSDAKGKQP